MSNEASYPSKYCPGKNVSIANRLAEIMVERQARSKGIELPTYFWRTLKDWERSYRLQLRHARALLKLYEPKAIGNALRSKEGRKVYSLGAKWLDAIIVEEQRKLTVSKEARARVEEKPCPVPATPSGQRPAFQSGVSVKDKLKGL